MKLIQWLKNLFIRPQHQAKELEKEIIVTPPPKHPTMVKARKLHYKSLQKAHFGNFSPVKPLR